MSLAAPTLREAYDNLKLKRFEIDTLMLVAAAGAAALGSWAEGALLLFLFSLGHALEHYAMGRAKRAIEALAELAPDTAIVIRGESTTEIPVGDLQLGDRVLVRPNERLPADGFLLKGNSSINQAPVTGESIPVDKRPVEDAALARSRPDSVDAASRVFAGTINGAGAIEVEVTKRAEDSRAGAGGEDGERGRDTQVGHPALHRSLRADLRTCGTGAGVPAAVCLGGGG